MNVVKSRVPLKWTVAPETKPVPFTVREKAGPPGVTVSGINGWFANGTGFPGGAVEKTSMLRNGWSADSPAASVT